MTDPEPEDDPVRLSKELWALPVACAAALAGGACEPQAADSWTAARERMVRDQIEARDVRNPAVLKALRQVPRHEFVPESLRGRAYQDGPVPIGLGQTISQPYIVARMTELLDPQPGHRVLEVGTGSGYQAAVLSGLVKEVYSIELLPELARDAAARLKRLGCANVTVRAGDGYQGWPDKASFDAVIVTCGAEHVPAPLFDQLKPGGRLVIPVGPTPDRQWLRLVTKTADGKKKEEELFPVAFVPLCRPAAPSRP